jgi:hypothetical protein
MSAPILRGQLNGSDRAKALNVTANGASPDPWSEVGGMRTALPRYTAKTDRVRGGHTLRRPNRNKKKKPDAVRAEASSKSNDAGRRNTEGAKACFEIAVFAKSGGPLTKVLSLSADGAIKNDPSECRMSRGTARSVQIADVQKLAALIGQLRPNEAISLGALRTDLPDQVKVVTKAELLNGIAQPNIIARTGNNIIYRTGLPAFALLDYDTKGMPPDVEANLGRLGGFWDALVSLLAPLGGVARVTRRSTSTGLFRSDTGERLPESNGLHVYIVVHDGTDVERFLRALHDRCWLAGLGWMRVSKSGQMLERSIVDRLVGSPERLVFEGGPVLEPPLEQDRESRRPVVADGGALDTVTACPALSIAEIADLEELRARERQRLEPEAASARAAFIDRQARRIVERTGVPTAAAKRIVKRQCEGILLPDVELIFDDDDEFKNCTVGDILDNPDRFAGATLADPLEGLEYGPCKAKVLIRRDGTPWINSFAHGGITYELKYDAAAVRKAIEQGKPFIEVAVAADLTKQEEKKLCNYEADRSGTSRQAVAAMLKDARDNGFLRPAEPTYSAEGTYSSAEEARNRTRQIIQDFLEKNVACPKAKSDPFREFAISTFRKLPIAKAMRVATGIGKTKIAIQEIAKWMGEVTVGPIIYAVPRHKLGREIERQFADHGVNARVFRGRNATDPEYPEKKMCLNPAAVELAMKCHEDIPTTCCKKSKKVKCRFFDECGYQRQMRGERADVWIVAGDMLFHTQDVFGEPSAVIIDEAIWKKGIRGIEGQEWVVAIDSLLGPEPEFYDDVGLRNSDRNALGESLRKQQNGGVRRQPLAEIFLTGEPPVDRVVSAIVRREWKCCPKIDLRPGMSDAEIKRLAKESDLIDDIQHSRRIIKIWEAVREMLRDPDIEVSGRLTIKQRNGQRVVEWRGVEQISKQFQVPTLLLDATLPEASILQVYHPEVEVVADIQVEMPPHVRIRQVLRAPTSSSKLEKEVHREDVRRYILRRWMETGRGRTLVICQEKFEQWLKLPDDIEVAHFNDISGLDVHRNIRLLIIVGRTAPGPRAMEAQAAALSGRQPTLVNGEGFVWYPPVKRGIRLLDGRGVETTGDQHPDELVEPVRWLVHEGELIQALGRGRGINRTEQTPLDVDLLFDTCLPIKVNDVSIWRRPSALVETAVQGVMLTAQSDMVKVYPEIWSNNSAADRTMEQGVPELPGFAPLTYQLAGRKRRLAYFDLTIIPEPMVWLRGRLGTPLRLLSP